MTRVIVFTWCAADDRDGSGGGRRAELRDHDAGHLYPAAEAGLRGRADRRYCRGLDVPDRRSQLG